MDEEPLEIEKIKAIPKGHKEEVQRFIDWLYDEKIWSIASWGDDPHDDYNPVERSREQIMAEFYGIDLDKMSREREEAYQSLVQSKEITDER
jgi:hypothetical protein